MTGENNSIENVRSVAGNDLTDRLLEVIPEVALVPWFYQSNDALSGQAPYQTCEGQASPLLEDVYFRLSSGTPS